jgi:hypothetical protein
LDDRGSLLVIRRAALSATLLVLGSGYSCAAEAAVPSRWMVPYPFSANSASPSAGKSVTCGRSKLVARGPMGSKTEFNGLRWRGCGSEKVRVTGSARYCETTCGSYRRVTIMLFGRVHWYCQPESYYYDSYKLHGVPGALNGRTLHSGELTDC